MIQIGIRSPLARDIWDWTIGKGVTIVTAQEVHGRGPEAVIEAIRAKVGHGKTYLSSTSTPSIPPRRLVPARRRWADCGPGR